MSDPIFADILESYTCENRYHRFMDSLYFLLLKDVAREKCRYQEYDQDEERPRGEYFFLACLRGLYNVVSYLEKERELETRWAYHRSRPHLPGVLFSWSAYAPKIVLDSRESIRRQSTHAGARRRLQLL